MAGLTFSRALEPVDASLGCSVAPRQTAGRQKSYGRPSPAALQLTVFRYVKVGRRLSGATQDQVAKKVPVLQGFLRGAFGLVATQCRRGEGPLWPSLTAATAAAFILAIVAGLLR
jgi:hypothetical protein